MAPSSIRDALTARVLALTTGRTDPVVVGITGSVAVGKSTFAAELAEALRVASPGSVVEVVSSDSFLLPNRELEARGSTLRKGVPESFDLPALADALRRLRDGDGSVTVPVYDHFTYDIVDGATRALGRPDVVVLEGLALLADADVAERIDLTIYLDAERADIERWYAERFVANARRAGEEPGGFWDLFSGLDDASLREAAAWTWSTINLPNLVEHIEPMRHRADLVITKAPNHALTGIEPTH